MKAFRYFTYRIKEAKVTQTKSGLQDGKSIPPLFQKKETPDAFHKTTLHQKLKSKGIEKLVITGLQTEYCIDTTCRRAYSLGYDVVLVKDAHSTWDSSNLTAEQIIGHHNRVLGGWFVTAKNENETKF